MAKTQKSLSDNETAFGRPENFVVTVREFEHATGAGFIIPILGQMMRMPGLQAVPATRYYSMNTLTCTFLFDQIDFIFRIGREGINRHNRVKTKFL